MLRLILGVLLLASLASCATRGSFEGEIAINRTDAGPGFDPAMLIAQGRTGTITVTNTLEAEHGFAIEGLDVEDVVPPGQSIEVTLEQVEPLDYEYYCQLHDLKTGKGGHRRGILRVGP